MDPNLRARIVAEARVAPGDTLLEIGPGRGALTEGLAREVEEKEGRLVLVELDDELAAGLAGQYRDRPRVEVIHRDVLALPLSEVTDEPERLKVVGNIPYNLTSPILFHLLRPPRPAEILLMVQREVAERILSDPGGGAYGALTVGVRAVARVEAVLPVSAGAFRPRPRVDSMVIRLEPLRPPPLDAREEAALRSLTRALFQWRRKQLGKILRDHPDLALDTKDRARLLEVGGAVATDRPERVGPEAFVAMARVLAEGSVDRPGPEIPR